MKHTGGRAVAVSDLAGIWWLNTKLFRQKGEAWSLGSLTFSAGLSTLFELIKRRSMVWAKLLPAT